MFQKQLLNWFKISMKSLSTLSNYQFETLKVRIPTQYVYQVEINNPTKKNALTEKCWKEIKQCFQDINNDPDCRCVVLSGIGDTFSSGIDLKDMSSVMLQTSSDDPSRKAFHIRKIIQEFQSSFSSLESCLKPVIAAVHGACIGGAVDLICCSDIRMASSDAWFQIKEVAVGLAADVGTLQRFPRIVNNDSLVRELVYTSRKFLADEALKIGFLSKVLNDKDSLLEYSLKLAEDIASFSPVAVQSSKAALIYGRDHSVSEGLRMQADWNQVMLQSEDLIKSVMAIMKKEKAQFAKL